MRKARSLFLSLSLKLVLVQLAQRRVLAQLEPSQIDMSGRELEVLVYLVYIFKILI